MRIPVILLAVAAVLAAGALQASAAADGARCANKITGTIDSDTLNGTPAGDSMAGLAGDDALRGLDGVDCLSGDSGNDALWGGAGNDRVSGGAGADRLVGDAGADLLIGGAGADLLEGGGGRDTLNGGAGADRIDVVGYGYPAGWRPGTGHNVARGGPGRDVIDAANGRSDRVECGGGRDTVMFDRSDHLTGCERRKRLASPLPSASPRSGGRRRAFTIAFRSLDNLRAPSEFVSIAVKGPSGCGRLVGNSVGMSYSRNKVVRYRLKPFRGAGHRAQRWCRGRYSGTASVMRIVKSSCTVRPSRLPDPSCVADTRLGGFTFRVR